MVDKNDWTKKLIIGRNVPLFEPSKDILEIIFSAHGKKERYTRRNEEEKRIGEEQENTKINK